MKKKVIIVLIILFILTAFIILAFNIFKPIAAEPDVVNLLECEQNLDCGCGGNFRTGDCFIGNKKYVDTSIICPDFCNGISGNLEIKCIDNVCVQE